MLAGLQGLIEKAAPTLAATAAISNAVRIPTMAASGISSLTAPLALAAGAAGVGVGSAVNKLNSEVAMLAAVRAVQVRSAAHQGLVQNLTEWGAAGGRLQKCGARSINDRECVLNCRRRWPRSSHGFPREGMHSPNRQLRMAIWPTCTRRMMQRSKELCISQLLSVFATFSVQSKVDSRMV